MQELRRHCRNSTWQCRVLGTEIPPTAVQAPGPMQAHLDRQSQIAVHHYVRHEAYHNNLVSRQALQYRATKSILQQKRALAKREKQALSQTTEDGWESDVHQEQHTSWYMPAGGTWTPIYHNAEDPIQEKLKRDSKCAAAAWEIFTAVNQTFFAIKDDEPNLVPNDLFTLKSQTKSKFNQEPYHLNKYQVPDL